ncbi:MAG: FAD-binding oxidoreductase [Deltaproteobacteria bacterium]|nr:FAD-binding oxidoreductase [Deltaproteobacteria bacterium]
MMQFEPPKLKKNFLDHLTAIVGPGDYSAKNLDRFNYSRDSNFKSVIRIRHSQVEPLPDVIVWPKDAEQLKKLVRLAIRTKMPMIPFGGGSGVCGGTIAETGGMIVDMKKMYRLLKVDSANLLATAETGIMGYTLEKELQRKGYSLGHFPSSILCASLGGYLAARSAGQSSSRYGKIEDMVRELEVVTGKGEIIQTRDVGNGDGIDLNQIFVGSEGTLGFITKATLRIYPLAPHQAFRGVRFKNMKTGMEAVRRIMQTGLKPAVVRLYDEIDTLLFMGYKKQKGVIEALSGLTVPFRKFLMSPSLWGALSAPKLVAPVLSHLPTGCLLILMHEGIERLVAEEQKIVMEICHDLGGADLGEEPGRVWFEHRYSVSYKASPLFHSGAFVDTIEVAATWDRMEALYKAVLKAMSPHCLVMAHLSHAYAEGGSFYFTFLAPLSGLKKSEALYDLIWDEGIEACQEIGGVISHHHGVGRLKAKYMDREWGEGAALYRRFKDHFDPHGIMNPGKLVELKKKQKEKAA